MKHLFPIASLILTVTIATHAADLPEIPAKPIAEKKQLLFSDSFERTELGNVWATVVPTFTLENGTLRGTQTRLTAPAGADGKPAIVAHQAVTGSDIPTKDSVVEFRLRFAGATALSAELEDRKFTGAHYGHICRVIVTQKDVTLRDDKEGLMRNDVYAIPNDAQHHEEREKLMKGRSAIFPVKLEAGTWYAVVLETAGDEMRATIDGKPVAFLKSPGIAHATKSKIEFGCAGKDGYFDDVKIWNAEPVKR